MVLLTAIPTLLETGYQHMLTDTTCRKAKPKDKPYKLSDSHGLFLLVNATGKYWRYGYRFGGKQKTLALGVYPEVSLADAREKRGDARKLLISGVDPSVEKRLAKLRPKGGDSFRAVVLDWHSRQCPTWAESTATDIKRMFEMDIFPFMGDRPIQDITAPEILNVLRRIEGRGAHEKAQRARANIGRVFRYAIQTGQAERDPAADLRGALTPVKTKHHSSITDPKEFGILLRAIDAYSGTFTVKCAMQLSPLVFLRPGELRQAEWCEIDIAKAEWRVPGSKMKMKEQHIVPLSRQAIEILEAIRPLTGHCKYVFPSATNRSRPMSENTVNAGLRRLDYDKNTATAHGFRSTASTLLHEHGFKHEIIERQLAHAERNSVSAAYNFAEYLPQRRELMQWWGDYLDELKGQTDK